MANAYQQLLKAKSGYCKGKGTKSGVRKKASAYVKSAVKNGKTKTEAMRSANRVLNSSCSVGIGGKKRKKKSAHKRKLRVKHVVYGRRKSKHHAH